eukprot:6788047-Pyramimonas_sp.AAC.1
MIESDVCLFIYLSETIVFVRDGRRARVTKSKWIVYPRWDRRRRRERALRAHAGARVTESDRFGAGTRVTESAAKGVRASA